MEMNYRKAIEDKRLEAGKLMTGSQIKECNAIIHASAIASGICGFVPIGVADAVPISATQLSMVIALGKIFNQEVTSSTAKGIIGAAAGTFVGRSLVKYIPVAGWYISASVAAGVTEAIGWTVAVDMAKFYRKEWERQKSAREAADAFAKAAYYQQVEKTTYTNEKAEEISEQ